jgi:Secretion system C-terminal sorting domain/Carboxylesterase family
MKLNLLARFLTFILVIGFSFTFNNIQAQSALGCDGKRYLQDVFTDTTHFKGLQYGSNKTASSANTPLYMDVVQPKGDTLSKRPLIILAFGGGFIQGERKDLLALCQLFAKKGYVCATIDYRLYNFANGIPDSTKISPTIVGAIHDMKASIRYFRKDAKAGNTFKIDTNNIIVGGVSAGAITAMHVGQLDSTDAIPQWLRDVIKNEGGFEGNSGNPGFSSSVKAVLSLSGGLYQKEFIDKDDVPFIAYHGNKDDVVPFGYGLNVYKFYTDGDSSCNAQARKVGIRSSVVTVPGGGHTDIYDPTGRFVLNLLDFYNKATLFLKQVVCAETITLPTQDIDNQAIKIYPNPSSDQMLINFDKNSLQNISTEGYRVTVYDALGRQVLNSGNQYGETFDIQKSSIGKGFFIAHISIGNTNTPIIRKIVFE